jgi:hypothetical protein
MLWDHMTGPDLEPLEKPCGDCAVTCGFYLEISQALAREPAEVQDSVKKKWFCHNHSDRACRGNWDYLARRAPNPGQPESDS